MAAVSGDRDDDADELGSLAVVATEYDWAVRAPLDALDAGLARFDRRHVAGDVRPKRAEAMMVYMAAAVRETLAMLRLLRDGDTSRSLACRAADARLVARARAALFLLNGPPVSVDPAALLPNLVVFDPVLARPTTTSLLRVRQYLRRHGRIRELETVAPRTVNVERALVTQVVFLAFISAFPDLSSGFVTMDADYVVAHTKAMWPSPTMSRYNSVQLANDLAVLTHTARAYNRRKMYDILGALHALALAVHAAHYNVVTLKDVY